MELRTERANAAQLQAALSQSWQRAVKQEEEVEKLRGIVAAQSEAITELTAKVSDLRKFALVAIDDARGETRTWKDRAAYLEGQRQLDRAAGDVPPEGLSQRHRYSRCPQKDMTGRVCDEWRELKHHFPSILSI